MASLYLVYLALILSASSAFSQILGSSQVSQLSTVRPSVTVISSVTSIVLPSTTVAEPITSIVLPSTTEPITMSTSVFPSSGPVTITSTISTIATAAPTPAPVPAFRIHPNGNAAKCLDVRGAVLANGTPVQIFDCNGTPAQNWAIGAGPTKVILAGTSFCLDAGSTPGNGVGMKIWQCFDNLPAQDWFYTADQRIALNGQGQCLDLTNGSLVNTNQVQTWQCTDFDINQAWTISN